MADLAIKYFSTDDLKPYGINLQNCGIAVVEDRYLLTSNGDIYRIEKKGKRVFEPQAKRKNSNGYLRGLINGKDVYIHRLVATVFCANPNCYKEVNHIDGNKENNRAENLEWCSRSENNKHAFRSGLRSYDELSRMAQLPRKSMRKLSEDQVKEIRRSNKSDTELSKIYNIKRGAIYGIRHYKSYKEVV